MQALSQDNLAGNAFRVLGLPAGARQVEVDAAARRLRIWADPAQIPATPWDVPWLGPLSRSRIDIEQAVARLSDPVSRVRQRLFWFADIEKARQEPISRGLFALGASSRTPRYERDPWIAPDHDRSLARLASALIADPELQSPRLWGGTLADFCQAVRIGDYQGWFLAAEGDGDFEKRTGREEVLAALSGVSNSIAESLATRARDALDHDRADTCVQLVGMLRAVSADPNVLERAETSICDRIEDLLAARCEELRDDLYKNFNWTIGSGHWRAGGNRSKCRRAARQLRTSIDPLFEALSSIGKTPATNGGGDGPMDDSAADRMKRLGLPAARALRNLGLAWGRVGQRKKSKNTLLRARQMTDDREMTQKLDTDLSNLANPQKQAASGGRRRGWAVAAVVLGLSRLIATLTSDTHSRTPDVPDVPVYRMPDYREIQHEYEMHNPALEPWEVATPTSAPTPTLPGNPWSSFVPPVPPLMRGSGADDPTSAPSGRLQSLRDRMQRALTEPANDGTEPQIGTTPAGGP